MVGMMKANELKVGDTVDLGMEEWSTAIVKQIREGSVWFFRPYGTSCDFEYTGGVICLVGIEVFSRPLTDSALFKVIRHKF